MWGGGLPSPPPSLEPQQTCPHTLERSRTRLDPRWTREEAVQGTAALGRWMSRVRFSSWIFFIPPTFIEHLLCAGTLPGVVVAGG